MMRILQRCRRNAFFQYFEGLDRTERATFWICVALAFALVIAVHGLARSYAAERLSTPPADFAVPEETRLA